MNIFLHSLFIHTGGITTCLFRCINGYDRVLHQSPERGLPIRYRNPYAQIGNERFYLIPWQNRFCLHQFFQWNRLITGRQHFTDKRIICGKFSVFHYHQEFIAAVSGNEATHRVLLTDIPDTSGNNL